jgi:hypothetical protein
MNKRDPGINQRVTQRTGNLRNMRILSIILPVIVLLFSSCEKGEWQQLELRKNYYFAGPTKIKGWCNDTHIILRYLNDGDHSYKIDTILNGAGEMIFSFNKAAVEARLLTIGGDSLNPEYSVKYKESE